MYEMSVRVFTRTNKHGINIGNYCLNAIVLQRLLLLHVKNDFNLLLIHSITQNDKYDHSYRFN